MEIRSRRFIRLVLAGLLALVLLAALFLSAVNRPDLSSAERGRRLAEQHGCFACHGTDGSSGVFNPGRTDVTVPNWRSDMMMYASDSSQIRQWIENGVTDRRAQSHSWQEQRDRGALKMPAYGRTLSSNQINDLVTYVMLVNGQLVPEDSLQYKGYICADSLGCFGCHGKGGRLSRPNPGSFKGYVASWATSDFDDLVRNRQEFDEWIKSGESSKLKSNWLAHFFLTRSALRMPAYRDHLQPGDLDALWTYVQWLRAQNGTKAN